MKSAAIAFTLACLCAVQPALALRPGQPASTAEWVCLYRGIAAMHPDPKLRNADDLAEKLCSWPDFFPHDYAGARQVIDSGGEWFSAYFIVNARTHFVDAAVRRAAADGVTQVVILGAGFDSRAYRFRSTYPALRFFEVDLPRTSALKRARLTEVFGSVPDYVRYAPIDFDKQKLRDVLPPLGYDRRQRTLFILEGVSMYVAAAGNGATFDFIRKNSASGSRVVYDYLLRDVVEGRYKGSYAGEYIAKAVAQRGEPFVTGWTPAQAAAFARKHGLRVVEDLGQQEILERYLTGTDGMPDGRLLDWQRFIEAKVP